MIALPQRRAARTRRDFFIRRHIATPPGPAASVVDSDTLAGKNGNGTRYSGITELRVVPGNPPGHGAQMNNGA
ncbi:MAG: hypothetical protein OXU96_05495 [Gammaproteobacteria bacterium]|nr:hypothetical protein [Gammaproteobacteria bacterium]